VKKDERVHVPAPDYPLMKKEEWDKAKPEPDGPVKEIKHERGHLSKPK
jgi:hypothetical protein